MMSVMNALDDGERCVMRDEFVWSSVKSWSHKKFVEVLVWEFLLVLMCLPNENKFGMRLLYELKERKIFERDREKEREFQSPLITSF